MPVIWHDLEIFTSEERKTVLRFLDSSKKYDIIHIVRSSVIAMTASGTEKQKTRTEKQKRGIK